MEQTTKKVSCAFSISNSACMVSAQLSLCLYFRQSLVPMLNAYFLISGTVKTIWNVTAKLLMEKYFDQYQRKINPFEDIVFKSARDARNAKRKDLQKIPEKRKCSANSLTGNEIKKIIAVLDENTPDGLIKKLFHIFSFELAWRGGEACTSLVSHFRVEKDFCGNVTNRIEYNPIFTKTAQGGDRQCAKSKWLVSNNGSPDMCPVRLYHEYMSKRQGIDNPRFFVSVNRTKKTWYKNVPVGKNTLSKWTQICAQKAGLLTGKKVTNHSLRASAVSALAKSGVQEEQLIKITGHSSTASIRPYLQIDQEHHENIIYKMRGNDAKNMVPAAPISTQPIHPRMDICEETTAAKIGSVSSNSTPQHSVIQYTNCVFNCNTLNCAK